MKLWNIFMVTVATKDILPCIHNRSNVRRNAHRDCKPSCSQLEIGNIATCVVTTFDRRKYSGVRSHAQSNPFDHEVFHHLQ